MHILFLSIGHTAHCEGLHGGGGEGEIAIVATINVMRDKKRGRSQATEVRDITGYVTPTSYLNTHSAAKKICTKHSKIMAPSVERKMVYCTLIKGHNRICHAHFVFEYAQ